MKQKLVLLIALVLALAQGAAAEDIVDLTAENFTVYVGQQETRTITLSFKVGSSIDPDPDPPVVDRSTRDDYSVVITGERSDEFSASITSILYSSVVNGTMVAFVEVTYSPTKVGTHRDTLKLLNNSGRTLAYKKLLGNASYLRGDADGDGFVTVADITAIIDYILSGDDSEINLEAADVDDDGIVSVGDVSELIDIILRVPDMRLCTYIIVTETDGNINEYMIDENSKVNIVDGKLVLKDVILDVGPPRPRTYSYFLDQLSHLRYVERMVTYDKNTLMLLLSNEPKEDYNIEADSQTLNTLQP